MCRNIIIGLLVCVILTGAGCGILAFRYNQLTDRASQQAERIGWLANDVDEYRDRIEGITDELERERQRAGEIAKRLGDVTAENNRLATALDGLTKGIAEGRVGVERITKSEERTAEIYTQLEKYLNRFK